MTHIPSRFHHTDGWRGYSIPGAAVAGCSDTGTWDDSPCPSPVAKSELRGAQRYLRKHGIRTRVRFGQTSNCFCGKRWLCVTPATTENQAKGAQLAAEYMEANPNLRLLHEAN